MDFSVIPDIIKSASMENERPWTLAKMGELLKLGYELTNHPILLNWHAEKSQDIFANAMRSPEEYKAFNRTIVERAVWQAEYYSQVKLDYGVLTMRSKGIEYGILQLEKFLLCANEYYKMASENVRGIWGEIHVFRLTGSGHLQATITYFMTVINDLITLVYRNSIAETLFKTEADDEKVKYLLRQKANLLQQKDQFTAKVFNDIINTIEIELGYHKDVKNYLEVSSEIKSILDQFLSERNSRITSTKLLGYLLEENISEFCKDLSELVLRVFSYHDLGGEEPEKVYHYFLLGVFTEFQHYKVESNKESGKGRFDIMLLPDTLEYKGIIIEVKRARTDKVEAIEELLNDALQQITDNKYALELKIRGHQSYVGIAAVFYGKNLFLKHQVLTLL
jgi:hypothetical protein